MNRKKWFEDNRWFIDAIANGEDARFYGGDIVPYIIRRTASGFDIDGDEIVYFGDGRPYPQAYPIPKTERRYLGVVEMAKWLVDHGYIAQRNGDWHNPTTGETFYSGQWWNCGKALDYSDPYNLKKEWIKEIEV